jgi:hypothetical protein
MPTAEQLRAKAAKALADAEALEDEQLMQERLPGVLADRDVEVERLRARAANLRAEDSVRAQLTAEVEAVDIALDALLDECNSAQAAVRDAVKLHVTDDLLAAQRRTTLTLADIEALRVQRAELVQSLDSVPTPNESADDLDVQIERIMATDPLDLVAAVLDAEDEADARQLAELERGAISWNTTHPYISPDLAAHLAREKQAKEVARINSTPYALNPWDAAEIAAGRR